MKSVILFNKREFTYAVVGMNYSDDEALNEAERLEAEGGFTVDQQGRTYSSESELEARINEITKGLLVKVPL